MARSRYLFAIAACLAVAGGIAVRPVVAQDANDRRTAAKRVEVVFVLDTTGSMGPLIEGAKRKIWSIATSIVDQNPNAEVHMGLVAYRDRGDEYVTKVHPLTRDIQRLYGELLAFEADGGGDWAESVNEALDAAVTKIGWTQGQQTDRIAFLVGDAPPHMNYRQGRKYPEVMGMARDRGIIVNAVQAGDAKDTERVWRTIAQLGGGRYIPIPQDGGKVAVIETPYDREILNLQIEINRTVLPYGDHRQKAEVQSKTVEPASSPSVASDMASYLRKSGKGAQAVTGEGDLVGDLASGGVKFGDIKETELPDELRGVDRAKQEKIVEAHAKKRQDLSSQMDGLVKQRDAYIAQARDKAGSPSDSFDEVVKETLRRQIK